jgi:hypothetical protein
MFLRTTRRQHPEARTSSRTSGPAYSLVSPLFLVTATLNVAFYSVNILDKVRKLAGLQQFPSIRYEVSRS